MRLCVHHCEEKKKKKYTIEEFSLHTKSSSLFPAKKIFYILFNVDMWMIFLFLCIYMKMNPLTDIH